MTQYLLSLCMLIPLYSNLICSPADSNLGADYNDQLDLNEACCFSTVSFGGGYTSSLRNRVILKPK